MDEFRVKAIEDYINECKARIDKAMQLYSLSNTDKEFVTKLSGVDVISDKDIVTRKDLKQRYIDAGWKSMEIGPVCYPDYLKGISPMSYGEFHQTITFKR